jgi:hypothetical protein
MFQRSPSVLCLATVGLLFTIAAWVESFSEWNGGPSAEGERLRKALLARVAARAEVVEEVLAERMSLLEAAACFRDLDHGPPPILWDRFRAFYPGDSDDERHCHEVIENVRVRVEVQGGQGRQQVLRLEAELRQHRERGTLRLPDGTADAGLLRPPTGRTSPHRIYE